VNNSISKFTLEGLFEDLLKDYEAIRACHLAGKDGRLVGVIDLIPGILLPVHLAEMGQIDKRERG
jgi:hypothetical protein